MVKLMKMHPKEYIGLDRFEARKKILERTLKKKNFLLKKKILKIKFHMVIDLIQL